MTCTDFLSQLTDYFDGQISPELLEEVRAHTASCSHCEVVLDTTRRTIAVYRDNAIYEIPTDLRERLHSAIMTKCMAKKRSLS
jgi:anti-sigma factor RsiW